MVKFVLLAPRPKIESMSHLTAEQRYTIETLRTKGFKQTHIAEIINKDKSVICRELKRNCDQRNQVYKSTLAEQKCQKRHKEKPKNSCFTAEIETSVVSLLKEDYSPEQIVGHLKRKAEPYVSIERIYQHIWSDKKKGGLLYQHLRSKGKKYTSRSLIKDKRGQIIGRVDIDQRPKIVDERIRTGDFEADLIIGKGHKQGILTANDRATGLLRMGKVNSKEATEIQTVITKILTEFKTNIHTITTDNGKEFANHKIIAETLEIDYFFAKPYHSWERGSNENLNGLVRQYFPKGSNFAEITNEQIKIVEDKLNNRPRKRFGFLSPNQVYSNALKNNGKVAFIT